MQNDEIYEDIYNKVKLAVEDQMQQQHIQKEVFNTVVDGVLKAIGDQMKCDYSCKLQIEKLDIMS